MGDETIRKCSSCGKVLEPDDAFCTKCGALFEENGEYGEGGSSIGVQLLALSNDFLCVSKVSPQWFELASRSGVQAPGQTVTLKYQAVAQLVPEKYQVLFWESMMETLLGIDAGASHESTTQKAIDVNRKFHGYLMFGGPYGFHYDRLHRVVKAIANEQSWQFKQVTIKPTMDFKPAMDTSLPSPAAHEKSQMETLSAGGPTVEGKDEAGSPPSAKKRGFIPLLLAGAAILVVAVALFGILSRGGKETPIPEKPKTVMVPQKKTAPLKARAIAPKPSIPAIPTAIDYNAEGMQMAKSGKMEEAAALFEKAVQANPDNFNAWNNLGLALRKIGKQKEAVSAYQRAITLKPDFALVYKNLGIVLEQMDKKKEAADAYLKYTELNPSAADARAAKEKADMLMDTGQGKGVKK